MIPRGGYCPRHKVAKSILGVKYCQTKPGYWDAWERGMGPGQIGGFSDDGCLLRSEPSKILQEISNLCKQQRKPKPVTSPAPVINPTPKRLPLRWAVGITTYVDRVNTTLPKTVESLRRAGFDEIRLFVDGCNDPSSWDYERYSPLITYRPDPPLRVVGNWMLGMWELYVRNPEADRYAMFQDDVLCVANLREFLERSEYPQNGYWNLITHRDNIDYTKEQPGWCLANQRGLGACGLVFNRDALQALLSSRHMVLKPASANTTRSWKSLDGGILEGMKAAGYKEWVHNPSPLQHIGQESTIGNTNKRYSVPILSFPGEEATL